MAANWNFLKHPVELILSLWDNPQQALDAAKKASEQAGYTTVDTHQVMAPQGLCGSIPTESGSLEWVCQAFGQVMPGVVFWVSLTVFLFSLFFIFRFFRRANCAQKELHKLLRELESLPHPAANEWPSQKQADHLLMILKHSGPVFPPATLLAQQIQASLTSIDKQKNQVGLLKSVNQESSFMSDLKTWTGVRLAEQLPSWLTAIGLLTTFLAILLGLQGVKVLSNMEVQGIGSLVNGLSGKFFSSIVALGCAVTITIAHYAWSNQIEKLATRLIHKVAFLLPEISVERAFIHILRERLEKSSP